MRLTSVFISNSAKDAATNVVRSLNGAVAAATAAAEQRKALD
jgi:hypothetical protein